MPNISLKSITPKGLPKTKDFVAAIEKAALKTANLTQRDLENTTRTWQHKPQFSINILPTDNPYTIIAGTDDKIYQFVDAGTKPHIIRPRRSKYLRFFSGYRAKTRVGIIGSREGGSYGEQVFRQQVYHPGTAARKFMITIAKRRQKTFEQEISQAIAKIARG
jgi:hypothetical protein